MAGASPAMTASAQGHNHGAPTDCQRHASTAFAWKKPKHVVYFCRSDFERPAPGGAVRRRTGATCALRTAIICGKGFFI